MTKPIEKMLKAELIDELTEVRSKLESERNAFDQLAMMSAKHEASIGELFALLAEAHGLRQNGGYHDDDAERWSAWDNRASELLTHHREGTPLPFRTAEEAELALERMTAERDAYKATAERLEGKPKLFGFWGKR
ncbi:hypothetical protein [Actinocorallia libanotica]|uniref:Uncharacterized protein n=1 Tax=Actinocorallia libanotica TaxID=46162 RepID=A0ABN1Q0H9_9ACTN